MSRKPRVRVAIDFDGTLVTRDALGAYVPVPGAAAALQQLREQQFYVIIHSCRTGIADAAARLADEVQFIGAVLAEFGIPFDEIYAGEKLVADAYVDDRAVGFAGDWDATGRELQRIAAGRRRIRQRYPGDSSGS